MSSDSDLPNSINSYSTTISTTTTTFNTTTTFSTSSSKLNEADAALLESMIETGFVVGAAVILYNLLF